MFLDVIEADLYRAGKIVDHAAGFHALHCRAPAEFAERIHGFRSKYERRTEALSGIR
jgi:hypothetical protein